MSILFVVKYNRRKREREKERKREREKERKRERENERKREKNQKIVRFHQRIQHSSTFTLEVKTSQVAKRQL